MFPLVLLALVGQNPADEWRPLTADPRYEVRGHMERGIFRYEPASKRSRATQPNPAQNFGVILEPDKLIASSVRGNDNELARMLAEKDLEFRKRQHAEAAPCPPDSPNCPNRIPKPGPHLPHPPPLATESIVLLVLLGIFGLFFGLFLLALKIVLVILVVRWIYRWWTRPDTPTA